MSQTESEQSRFDTRTGQLIRRCLRVCRYHDDLLEEDYALASNRIVPIVAFAHRPHDARSSCIAFLPETHTPREDLARLHELGVPLAFIVGTTSWEMWSLRSDGPRRERPVPVREVEKFFYNQKSDFAPGAVFRAKTWARAEGIGFVIAADFDLKSTAAHGTFPAQGDVGGKGGGNGAHIGHFGGQAHAAAAQVFHIYPGGLELGFFPAYQADLMPLRPSHLLASLAEQLIPPAGFGLQLRFEQIHPLQTVAGIRHEGRHLIDPELGLLRYGGAFQVGDDPLADEELLQHGFVAKTKFGLPHIRLIVVTRPKHIPTIRAKETNLLDTTTQNARGMTKAGQIGATIQAICGAKSNLAPQTGGIVGTI